MVCKTCGKEFDELLTICGSCGSFTGYPNVRLAESPVEVEALDSRYSDALIAAEGRNTLERVLDFESAVEKSVAVFAMSVARLRAMSTAKGELYSNYDLAVRAQARRPASTSNDQHRRTVDAKMWGVAASEIRYGALSLDGRGLPSYGICFVTLADSYICHRASVLERNSFDFLDGIRVGERTPLGFRSNWQSRYKVAVTKCETLISISSTPDEFPGFLLKAGPNRTEDEFIEVHVYGPFDFDSFQSIKIGKGAKSKFDRVSLEVSREYATKAGKDWSND